MKKLLTVALAGSMIVATMAVPAVAKGPESGKVFKGKKAIGTVASFDATSGTLVADMRNGATYTGTVSPDAKVKLEHRGKPKARGNPTKGSLDDLVAGAKLLKMKRSSGVVVRIQLRPVGSTVEDHPGNGGGCKTPEADEAEGDDTSGDDGSLVDDGSGTEGDDTSGDDVTVVTDDGDGDATAPDAEDCLDPDTGSEDETDAADAGDDSGDETSGDDGSGDGGTGDDGLVEDVVDCVADPEACVTP